MNHHQYLTGVLPRSPWRQVRQPRILRDPSYRNVLDGGGGAGRGNEWEAETEVGEGSILLAAGGWQW